ncbi:MAG: hypothetical protein DRQ55_05770 [Planctomycetota bacterium]|nr:MAG: hypothetical protein DRQ55_05770 [Planctomycetota bacterium]
MTSPSPLASGPAADGTSVRAAEIPLHRCVLLVLAIVFTVELTLTLALGLLPDGFASRRAEGALRAALLALICYPLLWAYLVRPLRRAIAADRSSIMAYQETIVAQSRRRELESQLHSALEMADDELAVLGVASLAVGQVLPEGGFEFLLADNSRAHLRRVLAEPGHDSTPPGCGVDEPMSCPAVRRGKVMSFADSESLDACPKLRGRGAGSCAALCVPVTAGGLAIGVIHAPRPTSEPIPPGAELDLEQIANQTGGRVGMVRVLAKTQLQAETDPLTGLLNRRSLETKARDVCAPGQAFAVVTADLDHFKQLNDRHGHDAGDRALRVFSSTLQDTLRPGDLIARLGGEEFLMLLPGATEVDGTAVAGRVRERLARALAGGPVPPFSASFGVADSSHGQSLAEVSPAADQALYAAKHAGRDQVMPWSLMAGRPEADTDGSAPLAETPLSVKQDAEPTDEPAPAD